MSRKIVVLIPGTTASTLLGGGVEVWPGLVDVDLSVDNVSGAEKQLERSDLVPGTPNRWLLPNKGYGAFRTFFEQSGYKSHFASGAGDRLPPFSAAKILIGWAYDWRTDNTTTAKTLQSLLATIWQRAGGSGCEIHLVGHSMGGIVARAYLENVTLSSGDPWLESIKTLITLGTPHLGAPAAVQGIMGTVPLPPKIPPKEVALFETMVQDFLDTSYSVSTYELLPPPQRPFISQDGQTYSVFSLPAGITIPNLDEESLADAKTFLQSLNYTSPTPPAASIGYYCIDGLTTDPTATTCTGFDVDSSGNLTAVLESNAGDTVVPTASAQFQGSQHVTENSSVSGPYVTHFNLPSNPDVLQQLLTWIGT